MDWATYDGIAARYDQGWGDRFDAVARLVWDRVTPALGARVLDIGTGTGIVPRALGPRASDVASVTGCDRSIGMIRVARSRMPALRLVAADAVSLPFTDSVFDVATASFVLSHLTDYDSGLLELRRVLKRGGVLAMTSWAADTDEHAEVWRGLLAGALSPERLQAAVARVAPSEGCLDNPTAVERALARSGLADVQVHAVAIDGRLSLEEFLAERELSSGGRFARHALGVEGWARFLERARDELGRRFGPVLTFARGVLIGVGQRGA